MLKIRFLILVFILSFKNLFADEYFLTLRNDKVNLRLGPSFDYPIKIIYKKKYLPVLIKEKSENFRKIKDHENNTGWIHISQLSKKKSVIMLRNSILYNRPTIYSKPLVRIETGRLLLVLKCKNDWCKIKSGKYSGWIEKEGVWGRI